MRPTTTDTAAAFDRAVENAKAAAIPSARRPNDTTTITTLLAERAQLQAEIAALRAERDHLARMLNPPPQR